MGGGAMISAVGGRMDRLMKLIDLDTLPYRAAWDEQLRHHEAVLAGGEPVVLLVEHPPTVTLGRRADDARGHLRCDEAALRRQGIELVESDRGGDVTYHGPGQLVAYPIVRLADLNLSVGGYMKRLQQATIDALAAFHVSAHTDPEAVGVWVDDPVTGTSAKVAAFGVRVRRGATLHGLALNVEPDMSHYELIVPCGLDRPVTSLSRIKHHDGPSMVAVRAVLGRALVAALEK